MITLLMHTRLVRLTLEAGCFLSLSAGVAGADAIASTFSPPVPGLGTATLKDLAGPGTLRGPALSAAQAASTGISVPAADLHGYALYPGDLIAIDVYDQPDLAVVVRIPPSGGIRFPLLGEITPVVGRDVNSLGDDIKRRLEADYLQQATVTITVRDFAKRRVCVMGSVAHADAIALDPFSHTTALGAIGEAGGFLDDANRDAIMVMRDGPAGRISFIVSAGSPGHPPRDMELLPNDTVNVPHLDRVYIMGQVNHPGAVTIPSQETLTVSKAVSLAGGFDHYARESNVQLLRGGVPVQTIDVSAILSGDASKDDPRLAPGDTVFVPQRRY